MEGFERYALYYAPALGTELAFKGNSWLGRDPETGEALQRPNFSSLASHQMSQWLSAPARYGFHATIRAPFRLKAGASIDQLDDCLTRAIQSQSPVISSSLTIRKFSSFYALCPSDAHAQINTLAAYFVRLLEPFRASLDAFELSRRRQVPLTVQQDENLVNWGYPFVFDEFRFHMTLSGNVPNTEQDTFERILDEYWAPVLKEPFQLSQLCLFGDPGGGLPFKLLKRYELAQNLKPVVSHVQAQ